jgi:hypothetical protein
LVEQAQSGLTISAFCRQHNISTSGFYTQRKKQSVVTASTSAFVSTTVTEKNSTKVHRDVKQTIVLELSAARLTLPIETPAHYLITLLNGLSA